VLYIFILFFAATAAAARTVCHFLENCPYLIFIVKVCQAYALKAAQNIHNPFQNVPKHMLSLEHVFWKGLALFWSG
jgi:hypothetical protein